MNIMSSPSTSTSNQTSAALIRMKIKVHHRPLTSIKQVPGHTLMSSSISLLRHLLIVSMTIVCVLCTHSITTNALSQPIAGMSNKHHQQLDINNVQGVADKSFLIRHDVKQIHYRRTKDAKDNSDEYRPIEKNALVIDTRRINENQSNDDNKVNVNDLLNTKTTHDEGDSTNRNTFQDTEDNRDEHKMVANEFKVDEAKEDNFVPSSEVKTSKEIDEEVPVTFNEKGTSRNNNDKELA
mmetsp:Transcript_17125/g.19691  ORF Transcript_17125/g.19691 Transcript_17125/m.19691 type:complete len:238 (+) Transcript_17125:118-831(+)